MTKPREKNREELQAEIEDGKKKIRQLENREKVLRQKLSQEERRTRLVVFYRARREQFRPEHATVRFGKGSFFTEQNAAFCITHDLFCVFAQIQVSGRSQKSPQFRRLFLVRQSSRVPDSGGNVVQQHFPEKLRKQGVLGRKLTQRFFQIVPCFG